LNQLLSSCGASRRTSYIGLTAGLTLLLSFSTAKAEVPRTINDCEKIQAADAYNQCLASFGPVAHERGAKVDPEGTGSKLKDSDFKDAPPAGAGSIASPAAEAAPEEKGKGSGKSRRSSRRSYRHYGTHSYSHHANGRKSIQFDIR